MESFMRFVFCIYLKMNYHIGFGLKNPVLYRQMVKNFSLLKGKRCTKRRLVSKLYEGILFSIQYESLTLTISDI